MLTTVMSALAKTELSTSLPYRSYEVKAGIKSDPSDEPMIPHEHSVAVIKIIVRISAKCFFIMRS